MANKVLKIDGYGRTIAGTANLDKQEFTIAFDGSQSGAIPFGTVDSLTAVLAFVNGIEVNITYDAYVSTSTSMDILADVSSPGYPNVIDLYWNGSNCFNSGANPTPLGDLEAGDVVRIYSIDI
jgi:hypothetical protein